MTDRDTALNLAYLASGLTALAVVIAPWWYSSWIFHEVPADADFVSLAWENTVWRFEPLGLDPLFTFMLAGAAVSYFARWRARSLSPNHFQIVSESLARSITPWLWSLWAAGLVIAFWAGFAGVYFVTLPTALLFFRKSITAVDTTSRKNTVSWCLFALLLVLTLLGLAVDIGDHYVPSEPSEDNNSPGFPSLLYGFDREALFLAMMTPVLSVVWTAVSGAPWAVLVGAAIVRDPKQVRRHHLYLLTGLFGIAVLGILMCEAITVMNSVSAGTFTPTRLACLDSLVSISGSLLVGIYFLRWIGRGGTCWPWPIVRLIQALGRVVISLAVLALIIPRLIALAFQLAGYPAVDFRWAPLFATFCVAAASTWAWWMHKHNKIGWCEQFLALLLNFHELRVPTSWSPNGRIQVPLTERSNRQAASSAESNAKSSAHPKR